MVKLTLEDAGGVFINHMANELFHAFRGTTLRICNGCPGICQRRGTGRFLVDEFFFSLSHRLVMLATTRRVTVSAIGDGQVIAYMVEILYSMLPSSSSATELSVFWDLKTTQILLCRCEGSEVGRPAGEERCVRQESPTILRDYHYKLQVAFLQIKTLFNHGHWRGVKSRGSHLPTEVSGF
jgi:hypothetical protein